MFWSWSPFALQPRGSTFPVKGEEFLDGSVISLFDVRGEITGGQLILTPVVGHALTADPLAGAWIVGAIAMLFVGFGLAFHLCHCLRYQKKLGPGPKARSRPSSILLFKDKSRGDRI